jgi:ElaB/YqjD/DUF883 family membrane-anchored ribosome-binding protein
MSLLSSTPVTNAKSKVAELQADSALSNISNEFRSFVADVENLLKATNSLSGEELAKAKAKLEQRIAAAKSSAEELGSNIANRARKTAESANTYVHEQPWPAIGASAGIGFLVGYLLSRR